MSMRQRVGQQEIEQFLVQLGRTRQPGRLYLVGGAAMVHRGIRPGQTLDIDIQITVDPANLTAQIAQSRARCKHSYQSHPFHAIWCRVADPEIPVGHADGFTTSISLYLRPESVRKGQITNPHSTEVDWNDPNLDFARYSSTGVIGDPTCASAELGKRLWEAVVEEAAHLLQEAASLGSDAGRSWKSHD